MSDALTTPIRLGPDAGTIRQIDGGWELRFERRLRHAPERVWKALTTGDGLACWLAEAEIEAVPGGRMDLIFNHPPCEEFSDPRTFRQANEVLTWNPPTLFEHSFDHGTVVRWVLGPDGDGTRLVLTHRIRADLEALHQTLAGWHHHLEGLPGAIDGVSHDWSWERWRALDRAYVRRIDEENPNAE